MNQSEQQNIVEGGFEWRVFIPIKNWENENFSLFDSLINLYPDCKIEKKNKNRKDNYILLNNDKYGFKLRQCKNYELKIKDSEKLLNNDKIKLDYWIKKSLSNQDYNHTNLNDVSKFLKNCLENNSQKLDKDIESCSNLMKLYPSAIINIDKNITVGKLTINKNSYKIEQSIIKLNLIDHSDNPTQLIEEDNNNNNNNNNTATAAAVTTNNDNEYLGDYITISIEIVDEIVNNNNNNNNNNFNEISDIINNIINNYLINIEKKYNINIIYGGYPYFLLCCAKNHFKIEQ